MAQDESLSPADSLALIAGEQSRLTRRRGLNPAPTFAAWGLAWLLGYGACYLATATSALPLWAAIGLLAVLTAVAIVVPVVRGVQAARGVQGPSTMVGVMYGTSWGIGFLALWVINTVLAGHGLDTAGVSLLWSASSMLLVGLLYLAAGMLWRSVPQYLLGAWMIVFAAVSALVGFPGDFLVLSLAGGGGMLAQAAYFALRGRR